MIKSALCRIRHNADDVKLFCRNRKEAEEQLKEISEWLGEYLHLEVSPEKSGVTNLKKSYTEFLGLELKVRNKKAEMSESASNYQRKWVCTSRVKKKAMPKIRAKLEDAIKDLSKATRKNAAAKVDNYNSIVEGLKNYYSMATQVSRDFSELQYGLRMRAHNRLRNAETNGHTQTGRARKSDKKYKDSKQTLYMYDSPAQSPFFSKIVI